MQTTHQKYEVRSGTLDFGKEYEFKMVALLSLRCVLEDPADLWIASNADSVGAFDDIIFNIRRRGKKANTYMLQLKHKANSKYITEPEFLSAKGDFSLIKYSRDLTKLKQSCESKKSGIVTNLGDFDKITFALFTNRGVTDYDCLNKISDGDNMSILNTNKNNFNLFKFNYNSPDFDDINSEHCQNLYLISNQIHVTHLNEEISKEIVKIVNNFKLTHVNIKFVTEKFIKYIFDWAKGNLGGHYYLTKRDVCCKLTELFFCQYEIEFHQDQYAFYEDDDERNIWNTIMSDKIVTFVEANEDILKFLKLYIGSEVKQHIQEDDLTKLWVDNVSEQAQNFFYQDNHNLKIQMLKIVGNHGKITFMDISKCLWLSYKLPLILQANNVEEYENIMNIFRLENKLNVIIVNLTSQFFPFEQQKVQKYFLTLKDIKHEERDVILNQTVQLQGRSSVKLRQLINEDMYQEIKCNDVINILRGSFNIGNIYNPVSDYFIERTLSKVCIDTKALRNIQGEWFLIQNPQEIVNNFEEINSNVIIIDEDEHLEEINELKLEGKVIHRLIVHPDCLEWKETFGSIKNILHYQLKDVEDLNVIDEEDTVDDLLNYDNKLNSACIISANPGMGKSTLLDYVATQTCPDKWIIKVNLNDHHEYYEAIKEKTLPCTGSDHLMYFFQNLNRSKLSQMVFEKLLISKNILVLLDGFDEISISCKAEVTQIAQCLHEEGYKIWITTRPVMKSYLEEKLNTFSISIQPFTLFNQVFFLTKYFSAVTENSEQESVIANFAVELLKTAQVNLNDGGLEFTGIPLQTMLLADVFSNELLNFLSTGEINLDKKFDLLYLYQEFIKRKNKILCDKFGVGSKSMQLVVEEHQQLFALRYLLNEEIQEFDICKQLKVYYEKNQKKLQLLQLEGVLVVEETYKSFKITFVHRTFAEYLAALWLSEKVNSDDVEVKKIIRTFLKMRFKYSGYFYSFLFKMFDCLISKDCKTHLAIIHNRIDEFRDIMDLNPDVIDMVDSGGRTILHMIAIYRRNFNRFDDFEPEVDDKMLGYIEKLLIHKIINIKDNFGYTALDYAVTSNLVIANKICAESQFSKIGFNVGFEEKYFKLCALHKFKPLFKVLFLHFACEKLLFWSHAKTSTIESFCKVTSLSEEHNLTLINFAKDFGVTTLWELFQSETMNDLRFTVIYGTKDLFNLLMAKGANVNEPDMFNNTPLHYAARNERLDMVKLLISKGAEVDKSGKSGNTAMHYAAEYGYDSIVKVLLRNGADINKQNNAGDTPLHVAIDSLEDDIITLLLANGAKLNLKNIKGKVPLYYAAKFGLDNIISQLISKDSGSVNCQSKNGKAPLHSLVHLMLVYDDEHLQQYERATYLLLKAGADVNIQDKNGNTFLHYLCRVNCNNDDDEACQMKKKFSKYLFEVFLNKGADANLKNKEGKTVWDLATADNPDIIALLKRHFYAPEEFIVDEQDNQHQKEQSSQNCVLL